MQNETAVRHTVRPFRAPWWLRGAHAQTIGGKLFRPEPEIALRRERWETPDGDFLDLDFTQTPPADAPLVVVLHGLEGSARRRYMLLTYRSILDQGMAAVGLNFRSCSGEANRTVRFYHSGETTDLDLVLARLAERWPGRPLGLMGYSLGGNVLLKYLGEDGERARARGVGGAVAASVPFDLAAGGRALERWPMGRFYAWYFLRMLRRKMTEKREILAGRCDVEGAVAARTLREFDDAMTAPIHGFADAADYYRRSSSAGFLGGIRVPTLLLHSEDDPFLPTSALPLEAVRTNPYLTAVFTKSGGHVGFIGGTPWAPTHWAETEGARFLASRLM